jgi:hypothetical protein
MSAAPTTGEWLRQAVERVFRGSGILLPRIVRRAVQAVVARVQGLREGVSGWLGEGSGAVDTALRWILLAVVGLAAWKLGPTVLGVAWRVFHHFRWLAGPAVLVWLIASYRAGGRPKTPPVAAEAEPADEDEPPAPGPDDAVAALPGLVGDGRGVLLTTLQDHLQVSSTKVVRELLAEAGIPVRDGVRAVVGNGPGVHVDDIPLPSPVPSGGPVGDVGAGESANANTNNVRVRQYESGAVAEFTEDSDNPHRTHIHWAKTP